MDKDKDEKLEKVARLLAEVNQILGPNVTSTSRSIPSVSNLPGPSNLPGFPNLPSVPNTTSALNSSSPNFSSSASNLSTTSFKPGYVVL